VTDGLIVGIHDSDRGLCLSGRESLLSQERPKWFIFGKKRLSLVAAGAVTGVVSFLPASPTLNLTGSFLGFAEEDPDAGLNASRVGPEVVLLRGPDGLGLA
jgi:hypothetical protein